MIICKNCGVELEEDMKYCPLCGLPVTGEGESPPLSSGMQPFLYGHKSQQPKKRFTWEIVSLVLVSVLVATLLINFIINKRITWSEFPVAICLTIFSYVSLFAFWGKRTIVQMTGGLILSSLFLILFDKLTGAISWSVELGIPLLVAGNFVAAILITVIRHAKYKGLNLVAYAFLAAALLCLLIEGIFSWYLTRSVQLEWSVIVAGSVFPVVLLLLFLHFRLMKGRSLEKTFHV